MTMPAENTVIKVGPLEYTVIYSKDVTHEGNSYGSTHHMNQKIFISPEYSRDRQELTFIHELLHACLDVSGVNYRFENKTVESLPTAEDVVRETATILYQVMKDNPHVFPV